jgi:putative acetyltransferase
LSRSVRLRGYQLADETAAVELWRRSWQHAYPAIDFSARLAWWQARWRNELVARAQVWVAEIDNDLVGFVTVDRGGYLDQIVVAPEAWGSGIASALIAEAKRLSPGGLTLHVNVDNARAIGFYRKHGFAAAGNDFNPHSGAPVLIMRWQRTQNDDASPPGPVGEGSG